MWFHMFFFSFFKRTIKLCNKSKYSTSKNIEQEKHQLIPLKMIRDTFFIPNEITFHKHEEYNQYQKVQHITYKVKTLRNHRCK